MLRRSALSTVSQLAGTVLVFGHLTAVAAGCAAGDGSSFGLSGPPTQTLSGPPGSPPPSGSTGCDEQRWVAKIVSASVCPTAPGWNGSFALSSPPPGLADYCLYTWANPAIPPTAADIGALQSTPGILGTDQDCTIVGALAPIDDVNSALRPWLRSTLHAAVGALDALPATRRSRTPIRIDVLDTSPENLEGAIPKGTSAHGYTMGWLAQDLSCPAGPLSPSCMTAVTTHLALPQIGVNLWDVDKVHGGYFGTLQQLAEAINLAVLDWKSQAATGRKRLVINLSLGWQPYTNRCPSYASPALPPTLDSLDPDVVFGALLHASCHGALIVAAAGNHPGGASVDPGPTCPAAWQAVPAPTQAFCETFEGAGYANGLPSLPLFSSAPDLERPLIYGIGGLDHRGEPIRTTRPQSLGLHAAVAFQGVAGASNTTLEAPISGSSVAAAVVSGTAATLWSYRPDLTSTDIMHLLYTSGATVPGVTKALHNPAIADATHRVSLCSALSELCSTSPEAGCALACAPLPPPSPLQNPVIPGLVAGAIGTFFGNGVEEVVNFQEVNGPPFVPSDELQSVAAPPWDHPQPIEPVCVGPCGLKLVSNRLEIAINPAYPAALSQPTLLLYSAQGTRKVLAPSTLALPNGLVAGHRVVFQGVPLGGFSPVRATLAFRTTNLYNNAASVTEEILLNTAP